MNNTLVIIVGPTAIGKTSVSIEIAEAFNTEIISADSRQVYSELCIGTAVPGEEESRRVPHHFIQSKSIYDYYNASMFEEEVSVLLESLFQKHSRVIMTGGSGLYIKAVCDGIDELPRVDMDVREQLIRKYETEGVESLRFMLRSVDPEYYKQADLRNPKRLLKALEVSVMTGKPYSSFLTNKKKKRPFNMIKIGLNMERGLLYERINARVDQMIEQGLVEEAREFYDVFRKDKLNALNTVGYKELFEYFEGIHSKAVAIDLIKRNTRRYARKQLTWFSKDAGINWFHPVDIQKIIDFINVKTR